MGQVCGQAEASVASRSEATHEIRLKNRGRAAMYVAKIKMQSQVHNNIRDIFSAPDRQQAQQRLKFYVAKCMRKQLRSYLFGWKRICRKA